VSASPGDRPLAGIALMSLAVLLFTSNDVLGKWLLGTASVAQVLVLRSLAALALLAPLLWREGAAHLLRPRRPRLQLARVACGTLEVAAFYWAVSMMPLADTLAFWMAMPIFVAIAAALLLGERLERSRFAAVLAGFVGVLIALGVPAIAWLEESALIISLGAAVVVALVAPFVFRDKRKHAAAA